MSDFGNSSKCVLKRCFLLVASLAKENWGHRRIKRVCRTDDRVRTSPDFPFQIACLNLLPEQIWVAKHKVSWTAYETQLVLVAARAPLDVGDAGES